ncbi:uncharacterized protein [Anabrus simplex]|uniref:uncharacterized protein isoform X3 n=1 Tax=Anabrus simplex TaxID=316456 RepID=UPI0035A39D7B
MVQQRGVQQQGMKPIMMSGESPTPAPHGDRRFELKDALIGTPISAPINSSRNMLDKGVQISPDDLVTEPPVVNSKLPQTFVLKDLNPNLHPSTAKANSAERNPVSAQLESIDKADEILSSPAQLDAKPKVSKPEEEIETMMDQTDSRPIIEKSPQPEQEDSCLVDCLYYVDQCCECRIL